MHSLDIFSASFSFVGILNCGFSEFVSRTSLNNGICKSRETVGMPFFIASQVRMDSNTDTTETDGAGGKLSTGIVSGGLPYVISYSKCPKQCTSMPSKVLIFRNCEKYDR